MQFQSSFSHCFKQKITTLSLKGNFLSNQGTIEESGKRQKSEVTKKKNLPTKSPHPPRNVTRTVPREGLTAMCTFLTPIPCPAMPSHAHLCPAMPKEMQASRVHARQPWGLNNAYGSGMVWLTGLDVMEFRH